VKKDLINGFKKFAVVDGVTICYEAAKGTNVLHTEGEVQEMGNRFIEDFFPDLPVDNFGKQSRTLISVRKLRLRLDRQKISNRYGKDWGNPQIQLNREAVTKNKRNPNISIAAVILEGNFTYPNDAVNTAFKESLKRGRQVYATLNLDCEQKKPEHVHSLVGKHRHVS